MQFERAVQALCDNGVDFILIGGVAANLHGSAAVTFDLDVFYSRTSTNLSRLAKALGPFHPRPRDFPPNVPFVWDEASLRNATVLTLQTDLGKIDLLAEVTGLETFEDVKRHALQVDAFERRVATIDLKTLIRAKRASGRPKDLASLPELESLLEAQEQ